MRSLLLCLVLLLTASGPAVAQVHLLIVSGLGGEPRYVNDFHAWGISMADAATERMGIPAANVTYLAEDPQRDSQRIDGESRRDEVERALAEIRARLGEDERLMILLIGHGSSDARGARINLPGPDLTAEELGALLEPFEGHPVVVVNTASASGDFHEPLSAENRTIVTATRSGMERNETIFGGFFVAAFAEDGGDIDKDGRVTIAEAFEYASTETERHYENANQLQLEHARMEGDMELAQLFHLGGGVAADIPADAPPEVRALYEARRELEDRIASLRVRSAQMEEAEYQMELERLLLELARTNRAIQESQEGA
ncbi:MAG: hypothetical protein WD737_05370 [Gemmatimonadota bacterium]